MSPGQSEDGLSIPDPAQQHDLTVFAERVRRLDGAAVIRLRMRADGLTAAWAATGFDVLAVRVVVATVRPPDITCAANQLVQGLRKPDAEGLVDVGFPMDSAWRGALPPETGFVHLDDVPTTVLGELARQGAELAREHGSPGPPASLLDQEVLVVSGESGSAGVPMRCVMALTALGFMTDAEGEVVRVRMMPNWLRIDARYGSVFRRRGNPSLILA